MANKFAEILLGTLTPALESIAESKLVEVLQKLHDVDAVQYEAAIDGGRALVKALSPLVKKSKSPLDDAIISALSEAIETSAENNAPEEE